MKITGRYSIDEIFIYLYADGAIYRIARATGNWDCCRVGERIATGQLLTQADYDRLEAECTEAGIFELKEPPHQSGTSWGN